MRPAILSGLKIRILRKKRCLRQSDLSVLMGISQPLVSQLENGKFIPSINMKKKLADALLTKCDDEIEV